ncbi:MAG: DUF4142 domain-containing protein [Acidobacteriota bacterium]
MKIYLLILSAMLIVPLTALGQKTNHSGDNMSSSQSNKPRISLEAQHFLVTIATEDQSEIDLAHLALKKSNNPKVQQYAKTKILAADPSMEKQAKQIARENNSPIVSFPNATDKAEYSYLSQLSGKKFDQAYIGYEDAQQHSDSIMVNNESTGAKNQQVRSYAQKEAGPVGQAAQSAGKIAASLGI